MRPTSIQHPETGRPDEHRRGSTRFRLAVFLVAVAFLIGGALACGEGGDPPEDLPPGPVGPGDDPPGDDPPTDDPPTDNPPTDDPPTDDPPTDDPPTDDPPTDDPPADDPPSDDPPVDDPPVDDPPVDDPPVDDPPGDPLPDLSLSTTRTANTFSVGWEFFPADSCSFAEGCLQGTGWRRLLRFATEIRNIGDADVHLGDPVTQPELFEYDDCHGHFHLLASMSYWLLDGDGNDMVPGYKQSFCWGDIERVPGVDGPDTPNYPMSDEICNTNQGLTRGWADIYWSDLDCQFLDITDVPPGTYTFRATVNENALIEESDYTNNTIEILVEIPADEDGPPSD